jgi:adenylosuccinate synthase
VSDEVPYDINDRRIEPVYEVLKGWKCEVRSGSSFEELPKELLDYISYLERMLGVPITMVSYGADRSATIVR